MINVDQSVQAETEGDELGNDAESSQTIDAAAETFASVVTESVRWSPDRDRAIQCIREAAFWAKEAIVADRPAIHLTSTSQHILRVIE